MARSLYFTYFLLLWYANSAQPDQHPIVNTTLGALQGNILKVQGNNFEKEIYTFFGIPFAEPPIGDLRFQKPKPVQPWNDLREAQQMSNVCVQPVKLFKQFNFTSGGETSEDCLYLNIWTPEYNIHEDVNLKPVMVWIHGGGYKAGAASYPMFDSKFLSALGDVVIVSFNYRLGAFGLLNLGIEEAPGNQALWDQRMALMWVRDHIRNFGGNPDQVTIFGLSAGSMSVGIHLLSPQSQGLYHRAIMQSGGPMSPMFLHTEKAAHKSAIEYAEKLGCYLNNETETRDINSTINCLKKLDVSHIAQYDEANFKILKMSPNLNPTYGDDFFPIQTSDRISLNPHPPVELMIGLTADEGSIMIAMPLLIKQMSENSTGNFTFEDAKILVTEALESASETAVNDAFRLYFGDGSDDLPIDDLKKLASTISGDFIFNCPIVYFAEQYSAHQNHVYFYQYSHRSSVTRFEKWTGVNHGADLEFVFGFPLMRESNYTQQEAEFSHQIVDLLTSFAKSKAPVVPGIDTWPKYSENNPVFVDLKPDNFTLGIGPRLRYCNFWRCRLVF